MNLRRVAGAVFVIVAFAFLFTFVYSEADQLRAQEWTVRPTLMGASLLLQIGGLLWGVGAWKVLLRVMGQVVPFRLLARIWFISGLGRYIPGKIWQFVGAAHLGRSSGLAASTTVTALAAHTIFFLIGAAFVSVYFVPEALGVPTRGLTVLRLSTPLLFLLVHPAVIRAGLRLLRRITGKELVEWTGNWASGAGIVALAIVGWLITGSALYLFVDSLTPLPPSALPAIIGMNALSFIVGNLVFIAPAGAGAKEVSLAGLLELAGYMTAPAALVIAVAARLWTIAAEVIPALVLLPRGAATPATGAPPGGGAEDLRPTDS